MRKWILGAFILTLMAAALVGMGLVSGLLIQQGSPTPIPVTAQAIDATTPSSLDTASIYVSDLYQGAGEYPLHTWQSITVYGETFPACVVEVLNGRSTLTVNADDSLVCGKR